MAMIQDSKLFWDECKIEVARVETACAKSEMQPRSGSCYIISTRRRSDPPEIVAGRVSEASVKIAAQRIVEESHILATDDQVRAHLAAAAEQKKTMEATEAKNRNQIVFNTPKPA